MADEDYRWLDRDAAERLLSGEPFDGTDHHARERAAHLAKALAALAADDRAGSVVPADVSKELPGEAAAMAAFRQARGPSARAASTRVGAGRTVRIGRTAEPPRQARWARPVRFGLAAVLAGCMVGGVAVAAGTGVLPSPFGGHDTPGPAASASSVASPEPLASPSGGESSAPDVEPDDVTSTPDDSSREPGSSAPPQDTEDSDGTSKDTAGGATQPGSDDPQRDDEAGGWYSKVVTACRDYRSGELQGEKRRRLEEAAKGPQRVTEFCGRVLDGSGSGREQNSGGGSGGSGDDDGDGGDSGDDGKGDGSSGGGNNHEGNGGGSPVPPIASPTVPQATPTASYSAQPELPTTATVSSTGS